MPVVSKGKKKNLYPGRRFLSRYFSEERIWIRIRLKGKEYPFMIRSPSKDPHVRSCQLFKDPGHSRQVKCWRKLILTSEFCGKTHLMKSHLYMGYKFRAIFLLNTFQSTPVKVNFEEPGIWFCLKIYNGHFNSRKVFLILLNGGRWVNLVFSLRVRVHYSGGWHLL